MLFAIRIFFILSPFLFVFSTNALHFVEDILSFSLIFVKRQRGSLFFILHSGNFAFFLQSLQIGSACRKQIDESHRFVYDKSSKASEIIRIQYNKENTT
ncbi:MAG: hypothetical protein J5496_07320 [Lachnospiraceae bacterium]|nr:hypothetical protein [Lachnospiraceae bacterium]